MKIKYNRLVRNGEELKQGDFPANECGRAKCLFSLFCRVLFLAISPCHRSFSYSALSGNPLNVLPTCTKKTVDTQNNMSYNCLVEVLDYVGPLTVARGSVWRANLRIL